MLCSILVSQNTDSMTESEQRKIFEGWLNDHKGLMFKIIRAYAFTDFDQEDLFQEITVQVWKSVPNFKHQSAVSTWIYRVSLNTALMWKRKEKRHQDGRQSIGHTEHFLQESNKPIDDRLTWLYEKIAALNKIDRSLTLLLLDGFSYKDMSEIIGVSESNIGVKIHRIKKHLTSESKKIVQHGI